MRVILRKFIFPQIWTTSQQKVLLGFCLLLLGFLAIETWRKPIQLSDPPPRYASRSREIFDRLDPNVADAAQLAAIPNIGEKRAKEIVDHRESFEHVHPQSRAFKSMDDLMQLKGFGPATAAGLKPYLTFDQSGP